MKNIVLGRTGEEMAVKFLKDLGYGILATNYRIGHKEIDILAKFKEKIIFIEVKTRLKKADNQADLALSRRKIDKLKKAMMDYVYKNEIDEKMIDLEFLAIDLDESRKNPAISHFKNIY